MTDDDAPWLLLILAALAFLPRLVGMLVQRNGPAAAVWAVLLAVLAGLALGPVPEPWRSSAMAAILLVWGFVAWSLVEGARHAFTGQRYARARLLAGLGAVLVPFHGLGTLARLSAAWSEARAGRPAVGAAMLDGLAGQAGRLAPHYAAGALAMTGRHAEILDLYRREGLEGRPETIGTTVAALIESGRRLDAFRLAWERRDTPQPNAAQTLLLLFAEAGMADAVEHLVTTDLSHLSPETKRLMRSLAAFRSGGGRAAHVEALEALARGGNGVAAAASALRQARLDRPVEPLPAEVSAWLEACAAQLAKSIRFLGAQPPLLTGVTLCAILLNGAILFGDPPPSGEDLYRIGALHWPLVLATGDWWRLASAGLVHLNLLHLFINLASLWVLGELVERRLGPLAFLALAGLGAVLGTALALVMVELLLGRDEPLLMAGASVGIMALLGAHLVGAAVAWRREQVALARSHARLTLLVLVVQTVIDLTVLEHSVIFHLSGVVAGMALALVGLLISPLWRQRWA